MDLVLRLRTEMQNRSAYDKVFQQIWGASGNLANSSLKYLYINNIYLIIHKYVALIEKKKCQEFKMYVDEHLIVSSDALLENAIFNFL